MRVHTHTTHAHLREKDEHQGADGIERNQQKGLKTKETFKAYQKKSYHYYKL